MLVLGHEDCLPPAMGAAPSRGRGLQRGCFPGMSSCSLPRRTARLPARARLGQSHLVMCWGAAVPAVALLAASFICSQRSYFFSHVVAVVQVMPAELRSAVSIPSTAAASPQTPSVTC